MSCQYTGEPCTAADAWRTVGDHGNCDPTGRLTVTSVDSAGRAIVGGVNVALSRIHAVIAAHPAVLFCQVIPIPDDIYGQVLSARVTTVRPLTGRPNGLATCTSPPPTSRPRRKPTMPSPCDLCAAIDPTGCGGPLGQHLYPGQQHVVYPGQQHVVYPGQQHVVPTIGAFVPGYLLVVPASHSTSIGRLAWAERRGVQELTDLLAARLADMYGMPVLGFEYG